MISLKKMGYALVASTTAIASQTFAALDFNPGGVDQGLQGGSGVGIQAFMDLIKSFLAFITVIAVIFVVWAGFQLMTAGGDEEKMKKAKTIIIQVVVGIVIMWLAYSLVTLVIGALV